MSVNQKWDTSLPMEIEATVSWSGILDEEWSIEQFQKNGSDSSTSKGIFSIFSSKKPQTSAPLSLDEKHTEDDTKHIEASNSLLSVFNRRKTLNPTQILKMDAFIFRQFLTKSECLSIIYEAEKLGFGRTPYPKQYRGNQRLQVIDSGTAKKLWERLKSHVPESFQDPDDHDKKWRAVGLNEHFRLSKYLPGDEFDSHVDANFARSKTERSMYTVNIYLNGGFQAGRTRFYKGRPGSKMTYGVVPEAGAALVFRQPPGEHYLHDGERLGSDVKYLYRTDVMYKLM